MSPNGPASSPPPRVFLSYAWEDDEYKSRVESFAVRLCQDGVDARLDAWHCNGSVTIPEFMDSEVRRADKILMLCSPEYAKKVHRMADGEKISGAGWESMLLTSAIWASLKSREDLVVAVFRGSWREAIPSFAAGLPSFDLTNDATFEAQYEQLLRRLLGRSNAAPPVGRPPVGLDRPPVPPLRGASPPVAHPAHIAKLPVTDSTLFGRADKLEALEQAWENNVHLVQIVAPGGTGKTALVTKWYKSQVGEVPIYGWSFYRQGTSENTQLSSDDFLDDAVAKLHVPVNGNTADAKVEALLGHLRRHRTLLILDGLEPLQNHANGELYDLALRDLLRELALQNAGLVLCTTRIALADLPEDETTVRLELDNLDPVDGARYLREKFQVEGSDEELGQLSKEYGNHALALTLLGTYLQRHGGDRSRRAEIGSLPTGDHRPGRHARRVMEAYAREFAGRPEGDLLRGLGFFDRPAERDALKLVLKDGRIDEEALLTLTHLRLVETSGSTAPVDCHPLVREHFGALTEASDPEGFRAGHSALFDHYRASTKEERPTTLAGMQPLFHAVAHGCRAERYQEVCNSVYVDRILHGMGADSYYIVHKLGAFGTNLSLLAWFFERPWIQPVASLALDDQSWLLGEAAFSLRAVGRLADAVEPMRAGADARVQAESWQYAANGFGNLSQLLLMLGRVTEAIAAARRSVEYADRSQSQDPSRRIISRTTLADALHQAGDRAEAARLFAEAEKQQAEWWPHEPLLYSLRGHQYCDLLLDQDNPADVRHRAAKALAVAQANGWLLAIGLDHLTLGRAHPPDSPESRHHLEQAVAMLRRAGAQEFVPKALLARATDADLAEVHKIATRSGMRLHLTDYHLAMARRHRSLEHLDRAEVLIQETGYHRRDAEAARLREELTR